MNIDKIQDKIAIVFNDLEHREDTKNADLLAEVLNDIKALHIARVMGQSELLKCPFCGSEAEIAEEKCDIGTIGYQVQCKENEHSCGWWNASKEGATEDWNKRAF